MKIKINEDFLEICQEIKRMDLNLEEWSEIESDDMFQKGAFSGGFDKDEEEFCFSYFAHDQREYWFQVPLSKIIELADGEETQEIECWSE